MQGKGNRMMTKEEVELWSQAIAVAFPDGDCKDSKYYAYGCVLWWYRDLRWAFVFVY